MLSDDPHEIFHRRKKKRVEIAIVTRSAMNYFTPKRTLEANAAHKAMEAKASTQGYAVSKNLKTTREKENAMDVKIHNTC